mgnify:CR=1 FL=1
MTTPSGQISAQDIKNEFGEVGGTVPLGSYRVQETRGALSLNIGDGVPGSGTISYDNMRNKRLNIVVDYYADNPNLNRAANGANTMNARTRYDQQNERVHVIGGLKSKPSNTAPHRVRIHVNQTIGGAKGGQSVCALRTGNFDANTSLIVDVGSSGKIYGGGGDGGEGGNEGMDSGNDGQAGASALGIDHQGTTVNVSSGGLLRCGFGGGGGGGCGRQQDKGGDRRAGGGGGGGGAGFPGGSGGDRGRTHVDGGDGTAGNLNTAGDGGGGGNNHNQAYGGHGGEGGQQGEGADNGAGAQHGALGGGSEGSAIRKQSGVSFTLVNGGSVVGATNQTGVS